MATIESPSVIMFPGQGSQVKGMGRDLFVDYSSLTDQASNILGYSISELCLVDPENKLSLTQFTQPALYVVNALSYLRFIEGNREEIQYFLGHSLGEYNALFAAGAYDFITGVKLVKIRAELMARAGDGGMAAVIGLNEDQVRHILNTHPQIELYIANYNSPEQFVLSGNLQHIQNARETFEKNGAKAYIILKTSSAFHSPYMQKASQSFEKSIAKIDFNKLHTSVISNISAKPYNDDLISSGLVEQIFKPVQWTQSITYLYQSGIKHYLELGPGKVLTKLQQNIYSSLASTLDTPKPTKFIISNTTQNITIHNKNEKNKIDNRTNEIIQSGIFSNDKIRQRCDDTTTLRQFIDAIDVKHFSLPALTQYNAERGLSLNYGELKTQIEFLASGLLALGVSKGQRIGLLSENRIEWPLTYLAVASIGAVIVPLDVFLGTQELVDVIEGSKISYCFCSSNYIERLSDISKTITSLKTLICFDSHPILLEPPVKSSAKKIATLEDKLELLEKREFLKVSPYSSRKCIYSPSLSRLGKRALLQGDEKYQLTFPHNDDVAALIFMTENRFAELTHKGIMSNLFGILDVLDEDGKYLQPGERSLAILPFHHTFPTMGGFLLPLAGYLEIILLSRFTAKRFIKLVQAEKINYSVVVPYLLEVIDKELDRTGTSLDSMKFIFIGGASVKKHILESMQKKSCTVVQGYGLTEFSPVVTVNQPSNNCLGSIGKPIAGVKIKIHEPVNGHGELWVHGSSVMKGYSGLTLETQTIIENGWLKTGDLACLNEDGFLFISGRLKPIVVNSGGKNIYPAEIEKILTKDKYIQNIKIFPLVDPVEGECPSAIVYPDYSAIHTMESELDRTFSENEIHEFLLQEIEQSSFDIANYKVPKKIFIVNRDGFLPKNCPIVPNETSPFLFLDYYLNSNAENAISLEDELVASNTDSIIPNDQYELVKNFLIDQIDCVIDRESTQEDINSLDELDSIVKLKLKFNIEKALETRLSVTLITKCHSVDDLASSICTDPQLSDIRDRILNLNPNTEKDVISTSPTVFKLTEIQESFLISKHFSHGKDNVGCHIYLEIEENNLQLERLKSAWEKLSKIHRMLHAKILDENAQMLASEPEYFNFVCHDLRLSSESEISKHIQSRRNVLQQKLYSVDDWPFYTIEISDLPQNKSIIHLSIDEWIVDGMSLWTLLQDWYQLYSDINSSIPVNLPGFNDYRFALESTGVFQATDRDLDYWLKKLIALPVGALSEHKQTIDSDITFIRERVSRTLDEKKWDLLTDYCKSINLSPTALLLSVFNEALSTQTTHNEFSLILTLFNRKPVVSNVEKIVGPFISTNIFIHQDDKDSSIENKLHAVQRQLWSDMDHSNISAIRCLREMKNRKLLPGDFMLPVVFTSMLTNSGNTNEASWLSRVGYSVTQTPGVYLDHQTFVLNNKLCISWDYAKGYFSSDLINALIDTYVYLLESLAARVDSLTKLRFNDLIKNKNQPEKNIDASDQDRFEPFLLSPIQQSYFVNQCGIGVNPPSNCLVYQEIIIDQVNSNTIIQAWKILVNQHDALRTVITIDGFQKANKLLANTGVEIVQLYGLGEDQINFQRQLIRDEMQNLLFPLDIGPFWQLRLSSTSDTSHCLHIAIDMMLCDANSMQLLFKQLISLIEGQKPYFSQLRFRDFMIHPKNRYEVEKQKEDKIYWRTKFLKMYPGPVLPGILDENENNRFVQHHRFESVLETWPNLVSHAKLLNVPVSSVVLTVYAETILAWTQNLPFTLVVVNWDRPNIQDIDHIIGDFTKISWLQIERNTLTFSEKVLSLHQQLQSDLQHGNGLSELSRFVANNKDSAAKNLSVVFTNFMSHGKHTTPDNIKFAYGKTKTPGISMDNISIELNAQLHFHWDVKASANSSKIIADMFDGYSKVLFQLSIEDNANTGIWKNTNFNAILQPNQMSDSVTPQNVVITNNSIFPIASKENVNNYAAQIKAWNNTYRDYPLNQCLHYLIEDQVLCSPYRIAVQFEQQSLSFIELNQRANQLASYLITKGVKSGSVVALVQERSLELLVSLLAILKAGAAYLPIDNGFPEERISYIIKDSSASVVLTNSKFQSKLKTVVTSLVLLDQEQENLTEFPTENFERTQPSSNLAYIIYTSGSTGNPKGCMISHSAIVNRLLWMRDEYDVNERDRILQKTPYTFDVSVWEFFLPLLCGSTLIFAKPKGHQDPGYLSALIREEKITICHFVPSMLNTFLNEESVSQCTSLSRVFISGEALAYISIEKFTSLLNCELHNLYGPTEAAVDVSYWRCQLNPERQVFIGKPVANTQLYIVDENIQLVAPGEAGEILIGGIQVANGYLAQEKLTSEKFIPNHISEKEDEKLYRTGDLGYQHEDGNIVYLGRRDSQVKLRGLRIELGEIESRLCDLADIRNAIVRVRDKDTEDPKLVAWIVCANAKATQEKLSLKFIREELKSFLPDYMLPNAIIMLDSVPTTEHGKLNEKALPWPSGQLADAQLKQEDPNQFDAKKEKDNILKLLNSILVDAMNVIDIKPTDDLFDLGATSLTLVKLAQKVKQTQGIEIPVDVFLDNPNLAGISDYIVSKLNQNNLEYSVRTETDTSSIQESSPGSETNQISELPRHQFSQNILSKFSSLPLSVKDKFDGKTLSFTDFSSFLSLLAQQDIEGRMRYRYPSGGGKNAIQTYIYINDNVVESLSGGFYYHHPIKNHLVKLPSKQRLTDQISNSVYQNVFSTSAFSIFLIAEHSAIEPFYADSATTLIELDAGYITQLLQENASDYHLGVMVVDDIDFIQCKDNFLLSSSHEFISCLLVGSRLISKISDARNILVPTQKMKEVSSQLRSREEIERRNVEGRYNMLTKEELANITSESRHLRNDLDHLAAIPLLKPIIYSTDYVLRACQREYKSSGISILQLGQLMSLMQNLSGSSEYKLYTGDALPYQVNAYVFIKPDGILNDSMAGLFHYNDKTHCLEKIQVDVESLTTDIKFAHVPFNRTHYQKSKVNVFLIGDLGKTKANFGNYGVRKAFVEAGKIGQLMMQHQSELGLGICPIGGMRFETIRHYFNLDEDQLFLHCMLVGAWDHVGNISSPIFYNNADLSTPAVIKRHVQSDKKLAIIGIAGRYPQADTLEEYWRLLEKGQSAITEIPEDRWDSQRYFSRDPSNKKSYSKWGGFIKDIKRFDNFLFKMSPFEAKLIDPQERIFLEVIWECLENSGYTPQNLKTNSPRVGVFVGVMWSDYQSVAMQGWDENNIQQAFSFHSSIANRVSHFFDFEGPSLAIDSSCSSALSALHLARQSIAAGECDAAIVGGINLIAHPYHQNVLCGLNLLSQSESCYAFGENGTGWVVGEGVGAMLIKPATQAKEHRDNIKAYISASSISHSGATLRYGFPSAEKQAKSINACLSEAQIKPQDISYIESAATGSGLADSVESQAIKLAFGNTEIRTPIAIGSVKPNIGHLESASFMSQITKVLLQLEHGKLAPSINSEPRNPLINYSDSPFYINTELKEWITEKSSTESSTKYALINSFGATGSSGHIVIEEALSNVDVIKSDIGAVIIPLSAQSKIQLNIIAQNLYEFLNLPLIDSYTLSDIAFTLQEGRVGLKERVAMVVNSIEELKISLQLFINNPESWRTLSQEQNIRSTTNLNKQLYVLATKWMANEHVDWHLVQSKYEKRVVLPTYPFSQDSHWLDSVSTAHIGNNTQLYKANKFSGGIMHKINSDIAESDVDQMVIKQTESWLKRLYSSISGISESTIDVDTSLIEYGINSVIIQSINEEVDKHFTNISKTIMFECQTIGDLTHYLYSKHYSELLNLFDIHKSFTTDEKNNQSTNSIEYQNHRISNYNTTRDIAIIGMAGRYPQAENLDEFWNNLCRGKDCIVEVPEERWRHNDFSMKNRWGGFIKDVDKFDPLFFNISPTEAKLMDPQERQFLEVAWETIENAGYTRENLQRELNSRLGVFVGVMYSEYQLFAAEEIAKGNLISLGGSIGSIANRVSYVMNLKGPSMTIDTLCSSSLTALHMAVQSMKNNECDAAIVGGVNLSLHPSKYLMHAQMNMPSSDGRCSAFSDKGDGFVAGEGVGSILVKWLDRAIADGDQILGVIKATAVNHDGKTNGYTVPNPVQQGELIKSALESAKLNAADISYIEAHGTGTALGDPIEINGLTRAFINENDKKQYCAIGSVKSNIGHLEAASGIASITKVLLQMQHKQLVPSLHAQTLNRNIHFEDTPFYVQRELSDWLPSSRFLQNGKKIEKRIAGISSFGAGGSNAHIILEAYDKDFVQNQNTTPDEKIASEALFVLSAKNKLRLTEYVKKWIDFIEHNHSRFTSTEFANLLYTAQVGREAMQERLAILADNPTTLLEKLREYNQQIPSENSVFSGNISSDKSNFSLLVSGAEAQELIDVLIKHKNLTKLAKLWVSGVAIDWRKLYKNEIRQRVSAPSYPFAKESYWVTQEKSHLIGRINQTTRTVHANESLHPLLDKQRSNLNALCFSKKFTAQSSWATSAADNMSYSINGSVLIEMLHAAASQVGEDKRLVSIKHLHWSEPQFINDTSCEYRLKLYTQTDSDKVQSVISAFDSNQNKSQEVAIAELVFKNAETIRFVDGYIDYQQIKLRCTDTALIPNKFSAVKEFRYNKKEALILLEDKSYITFESAQDDSTELSQEFLASPKLIEDAIHSAALYHEQLYGTIFDDLVTVSIIDIDIHRKISSKCSIHITPSNASSISLDDIGYDISLIDGAGRQAIRLYGVMFKEIDRKTKSSVQLSKSISSRLKISQLEYKQTVWLDKHINIAKSIIGKAVIFDTDDNLSALIQQAGNDCVFVKSGKEFRNITWGNSYKGYQIDLNNEDHCLKLFSEIYKEDKNGTINIIHNCSKKKFDDGKNSNVQLNTGLFSLHAIAKQLYKFTSSGAVNLIYLYEGKSIQPYYEACGVFLKTLSYENPKVHVKTLAIEANLADVTQQITNELAEFSEHEYEVRYDGTRRKVKHYIYCNPNLASNKAYDQKNTVLRKNGVYLVTGGLGGLGFLFAKYLSENYQARLVLTGRRLRDDKIDTKLKQLQKLGSEVVYLSCDIGDTQQLQDCRALCLQSFGEINGIIHTAGVLNNGIIANKNKDQINDVLQSKVAGTMVLDKVFADDHLDFMVYFSSIIGVMGNIGQSDYAFANAFEDHFARYRNTLVADGKRYGRTQSINWPLWQNGGMSADAQTEAWMEASLGFVSLSSRLGLLAFEEILSSRLEQIIALTGYSNKMNTTLGIDEQGISKYEALRLTQCQTLIENVTSTKVNTDVTPKNTASKRNNIVDITQFLREKVSEATNIDVDQIDNSVEFWELGLDSILSMKIIEKIENQWNIRLYPNEMLEHNNIQKLSAYLKNEISAQPEKIIESAESPMASLDSAESIENGKDSILEITKESSMQISKLLPFLKAQVAAATGVEEAQIDINLEFWELGLDSILSMKIIENIEQAYGIRLYPNEMLEYNTLHKLEAYLAAELAASSKNGEAKLSIEEVSNAVNNPVQSTNNQSINEEADATEEFDWKSQVTYINTSPNKKQEAKKKVIFVLSTPRSGSTLFRVMLAGHSNIFSPPELHLLPYDTLDHWSNRLIDLNQKHIKEGLTKAIAELESLSVEKAIERLDNLQNKGFTVRQTYDLLLEKTQGRYVVDKSPNHALDINTLRNAESVCDEPLYIHLIRHPISVMESFVRNRFAKMFGVNENPWEYSSNLWRDMNNNIVEHLSHVPQSRTRLIRYEDLVAHPENILRSLCTWLDLPFETEMLNPYEGNKMTDGLRKASMPIGDPNFNQHKKIESHLAEKWKLHEDKVNYLDAETVVLAKEFGYLLDKAPEPEKRETTPIS